MDMGTVKDMLCVGCGKWSYYYYPDRCYSCGGREFIAVPTHIPEVQVNTWATMYRQKRNKK